MIELTLDKAILRPWDTGDVPSLARHANNRNIWINLRDGFPHPYVEEDARRFIAMAQAMTPQTFFCIDKNGEAIGGIGYTLHQDVERFMAEMGYWLAEPFWGQGIMTQAVKALTAHAMQRHRLNRVYATPYAWNAASGRVLEKAEFTLEGRLRCAAFKDGQIVDMLMYGITRSDAGIP